MRTVSFLGLVLLLAGCEGTSGPEAQFDPVAVRRPLNLARKLGPALTLAGVNDTFQLRLTFDGATGRTIFTTPTDDTVLVARVFRFRGLYYLVESGTHGADWVHAARIGRGQVQGLGTGYEQMRALSEQTRNGAFSELVRFRSAANDSLRLRFDRRQLRSFYAAQLDSLPIYRLLGAEHPTAPAEGPAPPAAAGLGPYPNPAQQQTTLDFPTAANRLVTLYNNQGYAIRTFPATDARLTFSVADLPAGNYVVRISGADAGVAPLVRRLLVQR